VGVFESPTGLVELGGWTGLKANGDLSASRL